ncbi:uncharacterized protein [Aegilops tauschii subsp. strangulata]|uniref:uncharacterized protein n=2 Tax=Triticinae TaxID=1648030 RepID=UPI001ABBEB1E|nr:uncharacterized protein LOC120969348 isoform X2 [Aegilops tauschii subsp. strangulata]
MRENGRPSAANLTAGGDAVSTSTAKRPRRPHARQSLVGRRSPSIRAGGDNFRLRARGMASALCSPRHHHRSYLCRRLRPAPPSQARPRSGPSGLDTTRFLRSRPMSTGRGCPASRSSMEASDSNQGPEHLVVLIHGIMARGSGAVQVWD